MENWTLRKSQTARIVGTSDPYRLRDVLTQARSYVDNQRRRAREAVPAWQGIGPDNVPGRIGALAISRQDSQVLYAGSAAGGVYKSTDGGGRWHALWSQQDSLAVGGLAVAPSTHDVVYVATGEWEDNVSSTPYHHFPGVGVYRTADGGQTWLRSSIPSVWTAAVAVDPGDPDGVFVAGDRSLHRSRDGGQTWDVAAGNVNGIFCGTISDVAIDLDDPARLYIGVHRSGVWRSIDGGDHWTRLTLPGLADASAISPKLALRPRRGAPPFVAVLTAGSVFTSPDGGDHFAARAPVDAPSYAAWCTAVAVDPTDEQVLLVGHIRLWRSTQGGHRWKPVGHTAEPPSAGHADQQAIVFDPRNHDHVYVATDGGVFESVDNGATWSPRHLGLETTQCYTVAVSRSTPLRIGITTQDNHVYQSTGGAAFTSILRVEGGWIEYDPNDSRVVYADTRGPTMTKSTDGGVKWDRLPIESDAAIREALTLTRHDSRRLLVVDTTGRIQRSTSGGASWTVTLDLPGVTLCAVEYAPADAARAYAASTQGRVWCSNDGGGTWHELPRNGAPAPAHPVNDIEVDPTNPRRVFLAFGANDITFGSDTRAVWRLDVASVNQAVWTDVSGQSAASSLPPRLPVTGLAIDARAPDTLYAAHLLGVHRSVDGGVSWSPFDQGLPNCFVSDLDLHDPTRALYLATMGRGLYRMAL
jgi:photosystem II stability/assembly factor-like uncharacterized protein